MGLLRIFQARLVNYSDLDTFALRMVIRDGTRKQRYAFGYGGSEAAGRLKLYAAETDGLRLLNQKMLCALLPDSDIYGERFLLLRKSMIAIRKQV